LLPSKRSNDSEKSAEAKFNRLAMISVTLHSWFGRSSSKIMPGL
jgi:hypothetical protein